MPTALPKSITPTPSSQMQLMETQRAEPSIQTEDTKEDVVVGPFSPLVFTPPPTVEEMFGFETNAAAGMIYLFFSSIFYITIEPFSYR